MKRLSFVLLAVVFLFSISINAQDKWTKVQTKSFTLLSNGDELQIKQVAVSLEQFREAFARLFPNSKITTHVPTVVFVFKDKASFAPFMVRENAVGHFQSGDDANYIALTTETTGGQNPYTIIFHEFVHLLVLNNFGTKVPLWYNEGLAEYYSTFKIKDERTVILGDPVKTHLYQIKKQGLLPLKELFAVTQDSPYYNESDKRNIFYAESWLLMHYLIHNKNAEQKKFFEMLLKGIDTEKAFKESFQMSYEAMEQSLLEYATKKDVIQPNIASFENRLTLEAETKTEQIEDAEAFVYLGDLLSFRDKTNAGDFYKKAGELAPKSASAKAALGIQKAKAGNYREAKELLKETVTAGTKNHLALYYYAESISAEKSRTDFSNGYSTEELQTMRASLKRVIELVPMFVESYRLLAFINLVANEQLDETVIFLKQGLKLSPNNQDLLFMLSQCYLAKSNFKDAKETLETIVRTTTIERYKSEAQARLNSLREVELSVLRGNAAMKDVQREAEEIKQKGMSFPPISQDTKSLPYQSGLRQPLEGEKQVRGQLVEIECKKDKSVLLVIKSDEQLFKLYKNDLQNVKFVTFTARFSVGGEIGCGQIKKDNEVVATYRPTTKNDGEIVLIEFIPKDFPTDP